MTTDDRRFDALTRRFATRRVLVAGLAGLAVAGPAATPFDAKKNKKCKKDQVKCPSANGKSKCVNLLTDANHCGGCDRACAKECVHGTCACGGNPDCPGGCACNARFGNQTPSAACVGPGGSCNAGVAP